MPEFYFDKRENRIKPVPDCSRYGLAWDSIEQRCKHWDCVEQIMSVLNDQQIQALPTEMDDSILSWYHDLFYSDQNEVDTFWQDRKATSDLYRGWQGMGIAQGSITPPSGGGGGIPGVDPISSVVSGVFDTINGLIQGARQRGSDEARSGVALQSSVDSIYYMQSLVQSGRSTKTEAYDAFYTKILPAFYNFILTLTTKSVVESRLNNQVPDLKNLFEKEVMSLPDPVRPSPSDLPASGGDTEDDFLPDNSVYFDENEYYGDDGSYYYENPDSGEWYYEDASGNYQQMDSEGNLYAGTSDGEYWETSVDGESYWESADGSFYLEYADGSWTSGDTLGNQCDGDGAGNWVCEDGSAGGDWRESPVRVQKQSGQTRRQGQITTQSQVDKYIKQAIALIPRQQRMATNAQRAGSAVGQRQVQNAQSRLRTASPQGSSGGLNLGDNGTLLLIAAGVALLFFFRS